jgi:hypothetical protein
MMLRDYMDYNDDRGAKRFMTNILREFADIARQAAEDTGFRVTVEEGATTLNGHALPSCVRVLTRDTRDHTPYWDRYNELKNAPPVLIPRRFVVGAYQEPAQ